MSCQFLTVRYSWVFFALLGVLSFLPAAAQTPDHLKKYQHHHPLKQASSHHVLPSKAASSALATEAIETINEQQMEIAARVLTGPSNCEFRQQVHVQAIEGQAGQFTLKFKNFSYQMVPEETTSGAVRLMDKKAGVVWIQIPSKSMLMNSKLGQRLIDNCQHPQQQLAAETPLPEPEP